MDNYHVLLILCVHIILFQNAICYIHYDNGHYIGVWINENEWDSHITWYDARAYCQTNFSTDLASVHNKNENLDAFNSVEYFINISNGTIAADYNFFAWIGLIKYNINESFVWSDGTDFYNYSNWGSGEPSGGEEDCVHFQSRDYFLGKGFWNDIGCNANYKIRCFVCNRPNLDTNTTTRIPTTFSTIVSTTFPTILPSNLPSNSPSNTPSILPSNAPSGFPSNNPSETPSTFPSVLPSNAQPDNITNTPGSSSTDSPSSQPTSNRMF